MKAGCPHPAVTSPKQPRRSWRRHDPEGQFRDRLFHGVALHQMQRVEHIAGRASRQGARRAPGPSRPPIPPPRQRAAPPLTCRDPARFPPPHLPQRPLPARAICGRYCRRPENSARETASAHGRAGKGVALAVVRRLDSGTVLKPRRDGNVYMPFGVRPRAISITSWAKRRQPAGGAMSARPQ